jgi:hypothetical protein
VTCRFDAIIGGAEQAGPPLAVGRGGGAQPDLPHYKSVGIDLS